MEDGKVPVGHDFNETSLAQQLGLHNGRKVSDAGARE